MGLSSKQMPRQDKMCKKYFGDHVHKRKERSEGRLGESSDYNADLTSRGSDRDWRLSGSVQVCPASEGSSLSQRQPSELFMLPGLACCSCHTQPSPVSSQWEAWTQDGCRKDFKGSWGPWSVWCPILGHMPGTVLSHT